MKYPMVLFLFCSTFAMSAQAEQNSRFSFRLVPRVALISLNLVDQPSSQSPRVLSMPALGLGVNLSYALGQSVALGRSSASGQWVAGFQASIEGYSFNSPGPGWSLGNASGMNPRFALSLQMPVFKILQIRLSAGQTRLQAISVSGAQMLTMSSANALFAELNLLYLVPPMNIGEFSFFFGPNYLGASDYEGRASTPGVGYQGGAELKFGGNSVELSYRNRDIGFSTSDMSDQRMQLQFQLGLGR